MDYWLLCKHLSHRGCFARLLNEILISGSLPLVTDDISLLVMSHTRSHALLSGDLLGHRHRVVSGTYDVKVGVVHTGAVIENATALPRDTSIVFKILFGRINRLDLAAIHIELVL